MAVSEQTPYIEYEANGVASTFALGFECSNPEFLIVKKDGVVVDTSTWSLIDNGIVFNEPPSINTKLVFERNSAIERSTNFQTADNSFRPAPLNNNLDYIIYILQEIAARLVREINDRKLSDYQLTQYVKDYVESVLSINNPEAITLVLADIVQTSIDGDIQTQQEFNEYVLNYINIKYPSITEFLEASETAFNNFVSTNQTTINNTVTQAQTDVANAIATIQPTITEAIGVVGGQIQVSDLATLNTITPSITNQGAMLDNGDIYRWKSTPLPAAWVFTGANYFNGAKTYTDSEIAKRTVEQNNSQFVGGLSDNFGNVALGVKHDGSVSIPKLELSADAKKVYRTLSIGNDDSIMHFGDSLSAGTYNLQHKAYVCQLSQLSPFRHVNYSDSGKMLINFHNFLLSDTLLFNATVKQHNPRYAIIATLVNDYVYGDPDIKYTQENLRRLVDNLLGLGITPIIFVEFVATNEQHQAYKAVADEYKIPFISSMELNKKIGGYAWTKELFHQPHVGMRTSGLFSLPMLDWIEQQLPLRTIKIYKKRSTFTPSIDADLLYKDVIDKSKKWQEIGIAHTYLRYPQYYDEIGETATANLAGFTSFDDYVKIQNGQSVAFTDYALIEIGLDAFARDVEEIKINLGLSATPLAYVRNNLDPSVALAAGAWNGADYQAKYALPRGAWKAVTITNGVIIINKADAIYSMVGNKVQLMLKGTFNLSSLRVDYIASKYQNSQPIITPIKRQLSSELLTQTLTDTTSLAGWTKVGTVNALVPIDRKPLKSDGNPVTGACTLTSSNSIAQAITLTASNEQRTFKVSVIARYFPKAWLDTTLPAYSSLDPNQVLDRNSQAAPITTDTFDIAELKLETWTGASIPTGTGGAAKHIKPVFMLNRPVEFYVDVMPFTTQFNIRLSAVSTDVQVSFVSVKEVL
ncbi:hypothetical protein NCZ17_00880 [Acinetobacter modestus]|uniref:SGNH/GDSL hydrolase family protein n=1 Tax=Acinetobacter modestus TaxID=1776740 RepID=UPI00202E8716|nr:hypothetical protein [Acinetobacter modestus]MCM1957925.1 hypothetical protein [Acinetobacter modestus]